MFLFLCFLLFHINGAKRDELLDYFMEISEKEAKLNMDHSSLGTGGEVVSARRFKWLITNIRRSILG